MTLAEAETAAARPGRPRRRQWLVWAMLAAGLGQRGPRDTRRGGEPASADRQRRGPRLRVPGLPAGRGFRVVNNLGGFHQDIYVPPQRGTFALVATITNNGTHPVTILSASPPQGSGLRALDRRSDTLLDARHGRLQPDPAAGVAGSAQRRACARPGDVHRIPDEDVAVCAAWRLAGDPYLHRDDPVPVLHPHRRSAMVRIRRQRAHAPARREARPARRHLRARTTLANLPQAPPPNRG